MSGWVPRMAERPGSPTLPASSPRYAPDGTELLDRLEDWYENLSVVMDQEYEGEYPRSRAGVTQTDSPLPPGVDPREYGAAVR